MRYKQNLLLFLAASNRHVLVCKTQSTVVTAKGLSSQELNGRNAEHDLEQEDQEADCSSENDNEQISRQQWQVANFRFEAVQKAKKLLKQFCNSLNSTVPAKEREVMEKFLRNCLLAESSFQPLRAEARAWFEVSGEVINQITGFNSFWEYFEVLTF